MSDKNKILVVDDEPDILKVVTFILKKSGYDTFSAVDGKEALDMVKDKKPDLILLDLRLPVMDGNEVCRRIKSDDSLKTIPVLLLTASGADTVAQKTKTLGADDYIIKPFSKEALLKKVDKFLKKSS